MISPQPPSSCAMIGDHCHRRDVGIQLFQADAGAHASGLESIELPALPQTPEAFKALTNRARQSAAAAEDAFLSSDFLRDLKDKSDLNRDQCVD